MYPIDDACSWTRLLFTGGVERSRVFPFSQSRAWFVCGVCSVPPGHCLIGPRVMRQKAGPIVLIWCVVFLVQADNSHDAIEARSDTKEEAIHLYKRSLTHLPIHPDVFDPSYKRRGDSENAGGGADGEEDEDSLDYSGWWYTYLNSTQQPSDYRRTCTGDIKVCSTGQAPRPTGDMYCMENRLNKRRVLLHPGSWTESTLVVWIAQVIMLEQLQVPTMLSYIADATHEFFPSQKIFNNPGLQKFEYDKSGNRIYIDTDILSPRRYAWDGLLAGNKNMDCNMEYKQMLPIPQDLIGHPRCPIKNDQMPSVCKPCTHVMLDVWDGEEEQLARSLATKNVEYGGELGLYPRQGWYAPETILEKSPELATYRGLMITNLTQAIFKRPLTFGEYCYLRKKQIIPDEDIPYKDPQSGLFRKGGERFIESFCRMFYLYHDWVDPFQCAFTPYIEKKIPEYQICRKFQVYLDDMWKYAPFVAADMETYSLTPDSPKIMLGRTKLYAGYFAPLGQARPGLNVPPGHVATWSPSTEFYSYGNTTRPTQTGGFLMHPGCQVFGQVGTSKTGEPGGSKWRYDLQSMVDRSRRIGKLQVTPLDMGEKYVEAWEMTNRLRRSNESDKWSNVGSLMYLTRPHPIFERYKYNVTGYNPMFKEVRNELDYPDGKEWKLRRIKLPTWNEDCEKNRRAAKNMCQFNVSNIQFIDTESYLKPEVNIAAVKGDMLCDYNEQKVYKVFAQSLKEHSPEAWYFLSQFQITNEDIEEMMGNIYYNPKYLYTEQDIPVRRRKVVADWIDKNRQRWEKWIPESAKTRRCLGEMNYSMTLTGRYIKGIECSGHGKCTPDKWLPYSGVCKCDRGWTGMVTIKKIKPTLEDCSLMDVGESINLRWKNNRFLKENILVRNMGFTVLSVGLVALFSLIITARLRDTPIWDKHGSAHSLSICIGTIIICLDYVVWIEEPTPMHCIARPGIVSIGATLIYVAPAAKFQYILGVISNVRENPAELVNVNSKYIVMEVFKNLCIPVACIVIHCVHLPVVQYIRVDSRIWEKYMTCRYSSLGITANFLMFFHMTLLSLSGLALAIRLKSWKRYDDRYYLYLKESLNMEANVVCNAVALAVVVYFFYQYESPDETNKLISITIILASFGMPSMLLIVIPKFFIARCFPRWNEMRSRYEKDETPLQALVKETKALATELEDRSKAKETLEALIDAEGIRFAKKKMNLMEQVSVLYESLQTNVPSLSRFLKGLGLTQYQETIEKNELNVKKLIHLRGNLDVCTHKVDMKRGHKRRMQKALFELDRVLGYHEKFYAKHIKPPEPEQLGRLSFVLVSASNIVKADIFGESDAYCKLFVNEEERGTSKVIDNSLNPVWNETFTLDLMLSTDTVRVEMYDHDTIGAHDFLGQVELTGASLQQFVQSSARPDDCNEVSDSSAMSYQLMKEGSEEVMKKGSLCLSFISFVSPIPDPNDEAEEELSEQVEDESEQVEDESEQVEEGSNISGHTSVS